jgi:chromosome segregation ATPase
MCTSRLNGTIRLRECEVCGESVPTAEVRWSELSELLGEAENARASRDQLTRQLEALRKSNERLQEELDESRTANAELARRIQPLKDSIAAIEGECARLRGSGTAAEESRSLMAS